MRSSQPLLAVYTAVRAQKETDWLIKAGKTEGRAKVVFLPTEDKSTQHFSGCFSLTLPQHRKNFRVFGLYVGHFLYARCNARLSYLSELQ